MRRASALLVLVGALTLSQEINRLVDMLQIEEGGIIRDGIVAVNCTVEPMRSGGMIVRCQADGHAHSMSASDVQEK